MNLFTVFAWTTQIAGGSLAGLGLHLLFSTSLWLFGGILALAGASLLMVPVVLADLYEQHTKLARATAEGFAFLAR